MTSNLWDSNDLQEWKSMAEKVQPCLQLKANSGKRTSNLPTLDSETQEIKEKLKTESFLTTEELAKIMEWKMARNKFRPGLIAKARRNSDKITKNVSTVAFDMIGGEEKPDLDTVKQSIKKMSELFGIGPATSSLILSLKSKWLPFGADEALNATGVKKPKYNLKEYLIFMEDIWEKHENLGSPQDFGPALMSDCLWAERIWMKYGDDEGEN